MNKPNIMNTSVKLLCILCLLLCNQSIFAQKTINEYVAKTKGEEIKKNIIIDAFSKPITGKSFKDGHGKNPRLSSVDQLPKTVALIAFSINDLGYVTVSDAGYSTLITYYSVSESGGNRIANEIHKQTISELKEQFKKQGAVLLTPSEFLDTPEKKSFYYDEFTPVVSKTGKFLSNLENKATDISVSADEYRYFDMGAAFDYLRSQSLGAELANKLRVDGILSIGIEILSNSEEAYVRAIKMAMHGPNPNPKLDKKYVGQKNGTGYYDGQLYVGGTFRFKNQIKSVELGQNQITSMDFEGFEIVFKNFI